MKRLLVILLTFFSVYFIQAQNWDLINTSEKYNYAMNDENLIYSTIFIDSVSMVNSDSVYHLNKTMEICPGCYDQCFQSTVYIKNRPQFFLAEFIRNAGTYVFSGDDMEYILKTDTTLNTSWVFNPLYNISAEIVSTGSATIFGVIDSIKTIALSSLDTIVISKSFGIIRFPLFDDLHQYVKLIGLENASLGTLTPTYEDIFDFNVGDIFEYEGKTEAHYYYSHIQIKYFITDKEIIGDTIRYNRYLLRKLVRALYGSPDTTYTYWQDTITYVKNSGSYLDKYASQIFTYNYVYKRMNIGYDTFYQSRTKYFKTTEIRHCEADTLYLGGNIPNFSEEMSEVYGEHRGLIEDIRYYDDFTVPWGEDTSYYRLIACSVGGEVFGTFSPDSIYRVGVDEHKIKGHNFSVYPNPARTHITILRDQGAKNCIAALYTINGNEIIRRILDEPAVKISMEGLPNGIYVLKLLSDKGVEIRKIVKQ